jgi:hypothetical protein
MRRIRMALAEVGGQDRLNSWRESEAIFGVEARFMERAFNRSLTGLGAPAGWGTV